MDWKRLLAYITGVLVHRFWRALIALDFELTPSSPGVANGSSSLIEERGAVLGQRTQRRFATKAQRSRRHDSIRRAANFTRLV